MAPYLSLHTLALTPANTKYRKTCATTAITHMVRPERHSNVSIKTDFITQADSAKTVISKATIKKRRR